MKQIKKVYVLTLDEKVKFTNDVLVLGTFSSERSAKQAMKETFETIYESEYSKMNKNDYIITKSDDIMHISEVQNSVHTTLRITETILDKWEK